MAYSDGIPIAAEASPGYIGVNHPADWVSGWGSEALGISPFAAMRGHPQALSHWQRRPVLAAPAAPQPFPYWLQSRPYDRGAAAFAPKFGNIGVNPIGAGIYAPYKLPPIAGPGARYQAAAIWFDVQTIPTSLLMNPTIPVETVNALIATSYVGASYLTTG